MALPSTPKSTYALMSDDEADQALDKAIRHGQLQLHALTRPPTDWPLWLRWCSQALNDGELFKDLKKLKTPAGLPAECSARANHILALCGEKNTDRLPPSDMPEPANQLLQEALSQRQLRPTRLADSHSCTLTLLLVEGSHLPDGKGQLATLTVSLLYAPGARLAWLPCPANATTVLTDSFTQSMKSAQSCVQSLLIRPVNDYALVWDIACHHTSLGILDGTSAGAALAVAALYLLKGRIQGELRHHLDRLHLPTVWEHLAISAALPAADSTLSPSLAPLQGVGGLELKVIALLKELPGYTDLLSVFVAQAQKDCPATDPFAHRLLKALNLLELVKEVAKRYSSPLTDAQAALYSALVRIHPDQSDGYQQLTADVIAWLPEIAARPATDLLTYRLRCFARWAMHREGGYLAQRFVQLHLLHSGDPHSNTQRRQHFPALRDLLSDWPDAGGFLIRGVPGGGKTTLLRHMDMQAAHRALYQAYHQQPVEEQCIYIPLSAYPWYLAHPGEQRSALAEQTAQKAGQDTLTPSDWLRNYLQGTDGSANDLLELLKPVSTATAGQPPLRIRFLFDAVNELKAPTDPEWRDSALRLSQDLGVSLGTTRVLPPVFCTRSHHPLSLAAPDATSQVHDVELQTWTRHDIRAYLHQRFGKDSAAARELDAHIIPQPESAQPSPLEKLFEVPMHLVLQCDLWANAPASGAPTPLARNRAELFSSWLWQQLRREYTKSRGNPTHPLNYPGLLSEQDRKDIENPQKARNTPLQLPEQGELLRGLGRQGDMLWRKHALWSTPPGPDQPAPAPHLRGNISVPWDAPEGNASGKEHAAYWLQPPELRQAWLQAVRELGFVEKIPAQGDSPAQLKFAHHLWGEFFAARGLLPARDNLAAQDILLAELAAPALPDLARTLAGLKSHEVFSRSQAGQMASMIRGTTTRAHIISLYQAGPLDEAFLFAIEQCRTLDDCSYWINTLWPHNWDLAAQAAVRLRARFETEPSQLWTDPHPTLQALRDELLDLSTNAQDYPDYRLRVRAGLLLGQLGDNIRFEEHRSRSVMGADGQGVRYLLPRETYWVTIVPAGQTQVFWIGIDNPQDKNAGPCIPVTLAAYDMAAFPVTVAEYSCFIEAGGYQAHHARHWSGAGAVWRQKYGLDFYCWTLGNSEFNNPAQPMTGVTCWEAMAYASWLAEVSGLQVRLPTQAQWAAAAGGPDFPPAPYPHGQDELAPTSVNNGDAYLWQTSPVGAFPLGNTPTGVSDMAGNVSEWVASKFAQEGLMPDLVDTVCDPKDTEARRALVSRGYGYKADACYVSSSSGPMSGHDSYDIGFRLCQVNLPH